MTERMKGQLVLALCTSLVLVSGALEHRLHARETDEASGGGKKTLTHSQSLAMYLYTISVMQLQWNLLIRDTLVHRPLSLIRRLSLIGRFGIKLSFYALLQHQ